MIRIIFRNRPGAKPLERGRGSKQESAAESQKQGTDEAGFLMRGSGDSGRGTRVASYPPDA